MILLNELVNYTDTLLDSSRYRDYCPNGLQVQGKPEVNRMVSAVTASQDAIQTAIERGADLLLVHHGYFWQGEEPGITGIKYQRIKMLMDNDISLLAYHLPLDGHVELGNNAQLARVLGLQGEGAVQNEPGQPGLVFKGRLPTPMSPTEVSEHLSKSLGREALHIDGGGEIIKTLAWCTGAAQGYIEFAAALGVDAYISGEISEQTVHAARELGIHYFAAGHYATECYGVQALGEHLAEQFHVSHEFVPQDNPV